MEKEMKALAQSLALFLNTEATVSGLFKDRSWLSDIAEGLFSVLINRSAQVGTAAKATLKSGDGDFLYRNIAAEQKDFNNVSTLEYSARQTEYRYDSRMKKGRHYPEPETTSLAGLSADMPDSSAANGLHTGILSRESAANRYVKQPVAYPTDTVGKGAAEIPFYKQAVYKTQQSAVSTEKLSGIDISRISDALGEQLHQKLAAGFPMYMR